MLAIKNVSHKNKWNVVTVQVHVEPPPISLIKIKNSDKLDKYFVTLKLCRDLMLEKSDLYELKMTLFDDGESEEFLLLICNFNSILNR